MNECDFHCHLDFKHYDGLRSQIVKECFDNQFSFLVTVADPYEEGSFERTNETLACDPRVYCMTGAHPHQADAYNPEIEKKILNFLDTNHAIGLGEAGLDYYYHLSTPENQRRIFKRQIALAKEMKLPLIIHSRQAEQEVLQLLTEAHFPFPVVFHCYTGNIEDAQKILELGYYISFSGIITFKKSEFLREIAKIVPLNRLFTETDSPYLAPEPYRGKTNSPFWVKHVAEKIAAIKNITVEEVNQAVNENFTRITGKK